jgi:hypothetical protein
MRESTMWEAFSLFAGRAAFCNQAAEGFREREQR